MNGERQKLEVLVRALGCPDLFGTCSAADLQWDHLIRLSPDYTRWKEATPTDAIRIARDFLKNNPHIVVDLFYRRLQVLFKTIFGEKFRITDSWIRYEFQGRGSVHAHFFVWIDGLPPQNTTTDEGRRELARQWGLHIVALNPDPSRRGAPVGRSAINSDTEGLENNLEFLSDLVNRLQRHSCSNSDYC